MKLTTKQLRQLIRESIRGDMDFQTRGRYEDVVPSELDKYNREEQAEKSRLRAKTTLAKQSGNKGAIIKAYTNAIASGLFDADEEEHMTQVIDRLQGGGKRKAPERDYSVPYSRKLERKAEADLLRYLKSGVEGGSMEMPKHWRPESVTNKLMNDFKSDWKKGNFETTMDWIRSKTDAGQYAKKPGMMSKIGGFFGLEESLSVTSEQLKQMIRETLNEMQSELPRDELHVKSTPNGWVVTGTYKGRRVEFDSSNKRYTPSIGEWDNAPRFMMARELLGHFGGPESEEGTSFNIRKQDLDSVDITVNGRPV